MVKKVWQTDRRTDRQTENTICRAAWSQLKMLKSLQYHHRTHLWYLPKEYSSQVSKRFEKYFLSYCADKLGHIDEQTEARFLVWTIFIYCVISHHWDDLGNWILFHEKTDLFVYAYCQYHGCWWFDNTRSQGISHGIDLSLLDIPVLTL